MDRSVRAHLALLTVNFIYGLNYVVAKGLMPEVIGPGGFIVLRVVGACILFWTMRAFHPEPVRMADMGRLLLCALFGVALNQLMFFHGLMRTSAINSSIIMVATPILVLVLSGLIIGERITWGKALGVALGATGALSLIALKPDGDAGGATVLGDMFILINATAYGIYLVIVKPLMRRYTAITVMSWSFMFGMCMVLPFGVSDLADLAPSVWSTHIWMALAFVVVMVTFVAYLLNTWALRFVSASVVGTYIYMQPVLAALFSWLFVRIGPERIGIPGTHAAELGWPQVCCAAAIFLGVHMVGRADR